MNPTPTPTDNTGKLMTARIKGHDQCTLLLKYTKSDTLALRALVASIHLKQGKAPTMSLIARRSLQLYRDLLKGPDAMKSEIEAMNQMTTPTPSPAPLHARRNLRKSPIGST